MMCRVMRLLLPLHVGGDLSDGLAKWISGHVGQCDNCSADLEELIAARNQVRGMAKRDTPDLPVDFATQVREKIERGHETTIALPKRRRWAWAAAAILLIAGFGWFSGLEKAPEIAKESEPVAQSPQITEESVDEFSDGDLAAMLSLLNPNRELTDAELDRKYPVVESVNFPNGTQMVYHTDDPNTKIVWVMAQEGAQIQ